MKNLFVELLRPLDTLLFNYLVKLGLIKPIWGWVIGGLAARNTVRRAQKEQKKEQKKIEEQAKAQVEAIEKQTEEIRKQTRQARSRIAAPPPPPAPMAAPIQQPRAGSGSRTFSPGMVTTQFARSRRRKRTGRGSSMGYGSQIN